MASQAPPISIICIFHDEAKYLAEAIDSVLCQTEQDFELLLVDDGSSDGSDAIALSYAERDPQRVSYLTHPDRVNKGMSASRNLGLAHAKGELVAFIDGDDCWFPDKLERQLGYLREYPQAAMVSGIVRHWDGGTEPALEAGREPRGRARLFEPPEAFLQLYPMTMRLPVAMDAMIRREVIDAVGGFEDSFTGLYEDQVLFAKIHLEYPMLRVPDEFILYRQHPESCVAQTRAENSYFAKRAIFLDWLGSWIEARGIDTDRRIRWALWRERLKLRFPITVRVQYFLHKAIERIRLP